MAANRICPLMSKFGDDPSIGIAVEYCWGEYCRFWVSVGVSVSGTLEGCCHEVSAILKAEEIKSRRGL